MENLFNLWVTEILREIRIFSTADITFYIIILALFMWIWGQIDRLMRLK